MAGGSAAALALVTALALSACSTEPARTSPPQRLSDSLRERAEAYPAAKGQQITRPKLVSFCYGRLVNDAQSLRAAVLEQCPVKEGWQVRVLDQGTGLVRCPALQPTRATFVCFKQDTPAELLPR